MSLKHVSLKNMCFQNNMCAEATLGEFAISLVLVISCEPVKVESEIGNSQKKSAFADGNKNNHRDSLFQYYCQSVYIGTLQFSLMGNPTVHDNSFKYKYKRS